MPPNELRDIDGDVYVSPRYLAGSTGIGDPALGPLLDLGWDLEHDDLEVTWNHLRGLRSRTGTHGLKGSAVPDGRAQGEVADTRSA